MHQSKEIKKNYPQDDNPMENSKIKFLKKSSFIATSIENNADISNKTNERYFSNILSCKKRKEYNS